MKKILLADDDPRIKALVAATLGSDFTVIQSGDGQETLEVVRRESPDLILLDVMMPKIDGFEVCRRLKSDQGTSHIPVIMLTGRDSAEDMQRGKEAGANVYFIKPFSPRALLDKVNEILEEA